MAKAPKKHQRNHVVIQLCNLEKKRVAESQYKKWQLNICKWIKVTPKEKEQYLFQIKYKGNIRLVHGDVIANKDGIMFGVIQEKKWDARIVTLDGQSNSPNMNGTFFLIDRKPTNTNTTK